LLMQYLCFVTIESNNFVYARLLISGVQC